MSNRRIAMITIREVIRLSQESKLSGRQIAKALNVSRPIVSQYIYDFKTSGLTYQEIINMPDDVLLDIVGNHRKGTKNNQGGSTEGREWTGIQPKRRQNFPLGV